MGGLFPGGGYPGLYAPPVGIEALGESAGLSEVLGIGTGLLTAVGESIGEVFVVALGEGVGSASGGSAGQSTVSAVGVFSQIPDAAVITIRVRP